MSYTYSHGGNKMDSTDLKIIALLKENSRISYTDISKEINLSVPSVIERINRLREDGVIVKNTVELDYKKLGKNLMAIISVDARSNAHKDFQEFCMSHESVLELYRVVGTYNTIIIVALKDTDELENLVDQIKKYGTCTTSIVTSAHICNSVNFS